MKNLVNMKRFFPWKSLFRTIYLPTATLFLIFIILYEGEVKETGTKRNDYRRVLRRFKNIKPQRKASIGARLTCNPEQMKPSSRIPVDADHVRPADIKHIGAMGDSFAIGFCSTNYEDELADAFPGNSFFTGGDETLEKHITVANVLRKFNPRLGGMSFGQGLGGANFNVATPGSSSADLPRQAQTLVDRINLEGRNVWNQWKLIAVSTGIYDLGFLNCRKDSAEVPPFWWDYKTNVESALAILHANLNRTIIALIPVLNPQVHIGAQSAIDGIAVSCWKGKLASYSRDYAVTYLNKMLRRIQFGRRFESSGFAVVVQSFVDNIVDVVRTVGDSETAYYATDLFHLSKYGNAIFAAHLWNSLLEPVGEKGLTVNFSATTVTLKCPSEELPYIRTLGNSL